MMPMDTAAYAYASSGRALTVQQRHLPARLQSRALSPQLAQLCDRTFSPMLAAVIAATEQQES